MTTSNARRQKHRLVSQWLCDAYGEDDDIPPFFWRDADDLLKFLKANGWQLTKCTSNSKVAPEAQKHTLSLVKSPAKHQEAKQKLSLQ